MEKIEIAWASRYLKDVWRSDNPYSWHQLLKTNPASAMIDKKTKIGRKFLFPSSVVTAMQGQSINYLTYSFSILMPLFPHKNLLWHLMQGQIVVKIFMESHLHFMRSCIYSQVSNKRVDLNKRVGRHFHYIGLFLPTRFNLWKFAGREDSFPENNKRVYPFIRDLRVVTKMEYYD